MLINEAEREMMKLVDDCPGPLMISSHNLLFDKHINATLRSHYYAHQQMIKHGFFANPNINGAGVAQFNVEIITSTTTVWKLPQ